MISHFFNVACLVCSLTALWTASLTALKYDVASTIPSVFEATGTLLVPYVDIRTNYVSSGWINSSVIRENECEQYATIDTSVALPLQELVTTTHTTTSTLVTDVTTTTFDSAVVNAASLQTDDLSSTDVDGTTVECTTLNATDITTTNLIVENLTFTGAVSVDTVGAQAYAIPISVGGDSYYAAAYTSTVATRYPLEAEVRYRLPISTNPAGTTGGAWRTRVLNEVNDFDGLGVTLSSNTITIPAGSYDITAYVQTSIIQRYTVRLYDITHGATIAEGHDSAVHTQSYVITTWMHAKFTTDVSTNIQVQQNSPGYITMGYNSFVSEQSPVWVRFRVRGPPAA